MKIFLTKKARQVGYELDRSLQGLSDIIAFHSYQMGQAELYQVRNGNSLCQERLMTIANKALLKAISYYVAGRAPVQSTAY